MRITSTQVASAPMPERKAAQKTFEQDRDCYENLSTSYNEAFKSYQSSKERNISIGAAAGFVLGGAAMYYFGVPLEHGAQLALPGIVGGLAAAGGTWLALSGESKKLQPQVSEAYQKLDQSRETFREELLKEMNDQGVRDITQPRWEQQKKAPHRQSPTLNDRLAALTNLADSRLTTGWNGELAEAQDDPLKFQEQRSFIAKNPEVRGLIEN